MNHITPRRAMPATAPGCASASATPALTANHRMPVLRLLPARLALLGLAGLGLQAGTAHAEQNGALCSPQTSETLEVEFVNRASQPVSFHWMQFDCAEGGGPTLPAGQREKGITHPGHIFLVRGAGEQVLGHFVASAEQTAFVVDDALIARIAADGEPYTEGACSPKTAGRFTVEFVNLLNEPITMQWIGFDCQVHVLRQIPAHGSTRETTFPGHVFRFVDSTGRQLRSLDVATDELTYHIADD